MSKRRSNGEGNVTKRKDGRWECSIMIGFQKDGRRKRKSFYGKTKQEALQKMRDYHRDMENGLQLDPNLLFAEWANTWFESHKENISAVTRESYSYMLGTLKEVLGMVGHADLDMTQHYLHVQAPVKQKAIQVFDQAFCVA